MKYNFRRFKAGIDLKMVNYLVVSYIRVDDIIQLFWFLTTHVHNQHSNQPTENRTTNYINR